MTSLASNCSICIGCRICWQMICAKNESNMQELCCHFFMLPNVMINFILWPVMNRGFSWIHSHVARGLYREMIWSQNRDMIFRGKNAYLRSYRIRAASMLSTDSQMILKWTAPILCQIYLFHSNKRSFLKEGRCIKTTCGSSWQLLRS
jgi:hypothetical protein